MREHKRELMTYEQWKAIYKKHIRKLIRRKVINCLWLIGTVMVSYKQ